METYKEYTIRNDRPMVIGYGHSMYDRIDWLVAPVELSAMDYEINFQNFSTALKMLGGEGVDVEIHMHGHQRYGTSIILIRPGTKEAKIAKEIEEYLERWSILLED